MHFTRKDAVATALVAATVVAYIGYLAFGSVPFVQDVRGMAAVGLVLGFASRRIGGRDEFPRERLAFAGGVGSTALGIVAFASENELVLAAFMASIVALWAAAVHVHSGQGHGHAGRVRVSH